MNLALPPRFIEPEARAIFILNKDKPCVSQCVSWSDSRHFSLKMSSKDNNLEVAVEKATENNDKASDAKAEVKGTKRPAEVSDSVLCIS